MIQPKIEVEGLAELERNMAKLAKRYGKAAAEGAVEGANLVRTDAIDSIQDVSQGSTVVRTREGGGAYTHVVSAEGDAPNTDTGRLVSSIQVDTTPTTVFVGSTLEYAGYLEFGTRRKDARPWLFPALERNRNNIEKLMGRKIRTVSRTYGNTL